MSEKSRFTQSFTTSESKRYFGEKLSKSSSVASHRKGKLHARNRLEVRNIPLQGHHIREEDSDFEGNVAEEVIGSGKWTGEQVYGSAGKTLQKRRIKKQMVSAEHMRTGESAKEASGMFGKVRKGIGNKLHKIVEDTAKVVADNPVPIVCAAVLGILLIVVSAGLSSCTMMFGAFQGTALTTTYMAKDSEILACDRYYRDLEEQLADQMKKIEETYPGYDAYEYALETIGHDSYQLASLLTILYEDYKEDEVRAALGDIFEKQYEWTLEEVEETKVPEETNEEENLIEEQEGMTIRWDKEQGKYVWDVYTNEVEEENLDEVEQDAESEYLYITLKVTLTNRSIDGVVQGLGLTEDALKRYQLLMETKGNKSYLF